MSNSQLPIVDNQLSIINRGGAALLVVLFVVMAITILSVGFLSRSDVELACGENMILKAQMDYLAESALEHAVTLVLNPQDVDTAPLGYWAGDVRQQIVSGNDYYDVSVVRDDANSTAQWIHYLITCSAYREKNGTRIAQSNLSAVLVCTGTDLFGWWKLDEGSGQIAADSSGNTNDGQLGSTAGSDSSDPTWTSDPERGNVLSFDGSDDYIIGIGDCPTGSYTVACWAKDTGPISKGWSVLYSAEQEIWFGVDRKASPTIWFDAGGNGNGAKTAEGTWTRDVWHHLAATWDGTTIHLYLDGIDLAITIYGTPENPQAKAAVIAGWSKKPQDESWYGAISDVRVYDRALTADEIATLASGG